MKMDIVAGSKNDEFYTPDYAIAPILSYAKKYNKIWLPFDTEKSNFVKVFKDAGLNVVYTHIATGTDFFKCEVPPGVDCIVSNPPYSLKNEVFERLFSLGLPFAMLVGVVGLFESQRRFNLFKNNDFEIMYFNKRISYFKNYDEPKPSMHPPFSSVYLCHNMLDSKIVFKEIDTNFTINPGNEFI